jgi:hypothetical protein
MPAFRTVKGFRDFFPEECALRNYIADTWRVVARRYGFVEYEAPVVESTDLFRKKSGNEITAQLFCFRDKADREITLRPEVTPSLARMATLVTDRLRSTAITRSAPRARHSDTGSGFTTPPSMSQRPSCQCGTNRPGTPLEARTAVINVIVLVEIAYLFSCRSLNHSLFTIGLFTNWWAIVGALTMLLGGAIVSSVLGLAGWAIAATLAALGGEFGQVLATGTASQLEALSGTRAIAATALDLWAGLFRLLGGAYLISLFLDLATRSYLLMRARIDGEPPATVSGYGIG